MVIESVLVIDDEPDILTITRMSLQLVGKLEVWTASSGPEGIALAAERQPDLILLDLMMPEMDGAETLAHLRARPATARRVPGAVPSAAGGAAGSLSPRA